MDLPLGLIRDSKHKRSGKISLNPCCDGLTARTKNKKVELFDLKKTQGLNPCCDGLTARTRCLVLDG